MISISEAKQLINSELFAPKKIHVQLENSRNYFLAEDIFADRDYPPFNRAAVDGYAVRLDDIEAGIKTFHVAAEIFSGEAFSRNVPQGQCIKIMTGAAMPEGFDILFKVEHCEETLGVVAIPEEEVSRGLNISKRGENALKGCTILAKGSKVDDRTVHSLAAVGIHSVPVFSIPVVNIVSTGNEIVPVDVQPADFQIRDSNFYGLLFHLEKLNIRPEGYQIIKDNPDDIRSALHSRLDCDLLIVSGGVSMGDRDYIPEILSELGVEKVFHNVKIKPGKPLWFGRLLNKKTGRMTFVFALPGNPLSTLVSYKVFIEPWLYSSLQNSVSNVYSLPLNLERVLKGDRPEYFPARLVTKTGESTRIEPLRFHGSGDITAAAGSDGIAFHPVDRRELRPGDLVDFLPWN